MPDTAEVWSVLRLLTWTTEYLRERGSESPRLDAEVLLAAALGCSRVDLYTRFDAEPTAEQRAAFRTSIQRRAQGVPVAYLVGKKEFYALEFAVDERVLIPRAETEFVVVGLLDAMETLPERRRARVAICDVGTGSGNLAVTVASQLPNATVLALDISPEALTVAAKNVERHRVRVQDRVRVLESDLFSAVEPGTLFDFVVSNPPYVGRAEIGAQLDAQVLRHEPHLALFGGERGTELPERLLHAAPTFLRSGGVLFMEISPMIHDDLLAAVGRIPELRHVRTIRDLERRERVLVLQRCGS